MPAGPAAAAVEAAGAGQASPATAHRRPGTRTARALGRSTRWTLARPDMWAVGLAAFLARGGILVFALPFLILPTPIGIASFVGADAVTAAGPTERFLLIASLAGLAAGAAVVAGAVLAAAADRVVLLAWASDAAAADVAAAAAADVAAGTGRGGAASAGSGRAATHPGPAMARILAVRIVAAAPCALAIAWAVPRIADATYRQLTLPDDLATPMILRIASAVPDAVALVVVALLVGELIAGLATVHVVADGRGAARSLLLVVRDLLRRPVPVLASFGVGVALLAVGVGLPLGVAAVAWDAVRGTLAGAGGPALAVAAATGFAASIVAALTVSGSTAAWRRISLAEAVADLA